MLRFNEIIFGPIQSRRLGVSLGVNLLPIDAKICTFNCIYCECGFNTTMQKFPMPTRNETREALEIQLKKMQTDQVLPDVITFAGNGEPTIHPDFEGIIDDTIELRNKYCPQSKVSVLTNSTQLHKEKVVRALKKVENPILKFDSAIDRTIRLIDQPSGKMYTAEWFIKRIKEFDCENKIIQTMFLRGEYKGEWFDNTSTEEVNAWLDALDKMGAKTLMIYTIDRETPVKSLEKISPEDLYRIADLAKEREYEVSVAT